MASHLPSQSFVYANANGHANAHAVVSSSRVIMRAISAGHTRSSAGCVDNVCLVGVIWQESLSLREETRKETNTRFCGLAV